MKDKINKKQFLLAFLIGLPIAIVLVIVSPEFSRLGIAFVFELCAFGLLLLIDKIFYPKIDFLQEIIEDHNVALAILVVGLLAIPFLAS